MEDLSQLFQPVKELLINNKPLSDKDLMATNNPITVQAAQSYPINLTDVTFSIGAEAALSVMLFNDEDDKDPDTFLGVKDTPITFDTAKEAYLKYSNGISAKASGQASLADIGFNANLSASGGAQSLFYKKHPNTQAINDAFTSDIKNYKTVFRFEDVAALAENDALAFLVNGTLEGSLSVSWSNIFSQSLSALTHTLPFPVTLDLNIGPSLSAAFTFSVTDSFIYFIKKLPGNQCLVSVKKSKNTTAGLTAGAGIGIQFAQPDVLNQQLNDIYNHIVQAIFGQSLADINNAIDKFKQGAASAAQTALVQQLLTSLKLETLPDKIDALITKLTQLETDITNSIQQLAHANLLFSFSYQYKTIKESNELLSVNIATDDLKAYHSDLLRFKTGNLLNAMRGNKMPFTLHSYLNEQTLTVNSSWGFGLSVFNFSLLGQDFTQTKDNIKTTFDGTQVTIDRVLGYKWALGAHQSGSWMGEFGATMDHVSKTPTMNELDFSLLLDMILTDGKMSGDDFRKYMDEAVVWGAVLQQDVSRLMTKYTAITGKSVKVENKLLFSPAELQPILKRISDIGWSGANIEYLARALGACMNYNPSYSLRSSPQARMNTYTPLWLGYLKDNDPDARPDDYAAAADKYIRSLGNPDNLAQYEADGDSRFPGNLAGTIAANPGLYNALRTFVNGVVRLQNDIQTHGAYTNFNRSFNDIKGIFSQSLYLRAVGYFLCLHAADLNCLKNVKQIFTISYDTQVINFTTVTQ